MSTVSFPTQEREIVVWVLRASVDWEHVTKKVVMMIDREELAE
jgi:hypothetical protein